MATSSGMPVMGIVLALHSPIIAPAIIATAISSAVTKVD